MSAEDPHIASETARPTADRRRRASDVSAVDTSTPAGLIAVGVTFSVRRLEPQLAWAMAAYAMWVMIVTATSGQAIWASTLLAASVGAWSRMYPARRQITMVGRAIALIVAALLLQIGSDFGGPVGPFFHWVLWVTVFYALLLATPWAAVLGVLALLEFALACWLTPMPPGWRAGLVYGSLLVIVPWLATAFGRSIRQADTRAESNLRDSRTLLYNETGFFMHGAQLLADCQKKDRPFSMVLLNGPSLRDMHERVGRKMTNDLFAQIVQGIGKVPGEGIAARTDSVEFALLLPGVTRERAAAMVRQQLGDLPKVEVKMAGQNVTVMLDMAITQSNSKERTIEGLYDMMHAYLSKREKEGVGATPKPEDGSFDPNATSNITAMSNPVG